MSSKILDKQRRNLKMSFLPKIHIPKSEGGTGIHLTLYVKSDDGKIKTVKKVEGGGYMFLVRWHI